MDPSASDSPSVTGAGSAGRLSRTARWLLPRAIAFAPLAFLLLLAGALAHRAHRINALDARALGRSLEEELLSPPQPPAEARVVDGRRGLHRANAPFVPLDPPGADHLIYVFGGSSVVVPSPEEAFPAHLQRRLDEARPGSFRVVNFGVRGSTTDSIQSAVRGSLEVRKPDLLIFYEGHNDYWLAYQRSVQRRYGILAGSPLLRAVSDRIVPRYFQLRFGDGWRAYQGNFDQFLDPTTNRWLQRLGILRVDPALADIVDRVALKYFERNLRAILSAAKARGVPVLLVTPVSNLEFEPFGVGEHAGDEYRAGMAESDYPRRIAHLRRARDLNVFAPFIPAKSALVDLVRGLRGPGVEVLDLERELEAYRFRFGADSFYDSVHFNVSAHRLIADYLDWTIHERKLCCDDGRTVARPSPADPGGRPDPW